MLLACHQRSNIARHALFLTIRLYTPASTCRQSQRAFEDQDRDDESLSLPFKLRSERLLTDEQNTAARSDFYTVSDQERSWLIWQRLYPQRFEITRHPGRQIWPSKAEQTGEEVPGGTRVVTEVS